MCHSTSLREPFSNRFFAKIYLVGIVEWEFGVEREWEVGRKSEVGEK